MKGMIKNEHIYRQSIARETDYVQIQEGKNGRYPVPDSADRTEPGCYVSHLLDLPIIPDDQR